MELEYFSVGDSYGWDQERFVDPLMKTGGCAAVTACDSLIYFSRYMGITGCCPIETTEITVRSYKAFSRVMKPYLYPRWQGIDRLDIYIDGLSAYLKDIGEERIRISGFSGNESFDKAKKMLKSQIDKKIPLPCLNLKHKDSDFKDFEWHWFMLTGYKEEERAESDSNGGFAAGASGAQGKFMVKAVSYGEFVWLDFGRLWDTGYDRKGGLIIFDLL